MKNGKVRDIEKQRGRVEQADREGVFLPEQKRKKNPTPI